MVVIRNQQGWRINLWRMTLLIAPWFSTSVYAENAVLDHLQWRYIVVSTLGFYGPPKINSPQFHPPIPINIFTPDKIPCVTDELIGTFEAIIKRDGVVENVRYYSPSGTYGRTEVSDCQKMYIVPIINGWRFAPATYENKSIEVTVRVFVEQRQ